MGRRRIACCQALTIYSSSRELMKPGDLILLSGVSSLELRLQACMASIWNQTSLVVRWPTDGGVALLEATKRPVCADLVSGHFMIGVQVVSLKEKLAAYQGIVTSRPIEPPLDDKAVLALSRFAESVWGAPFNDSPFYAVRAIRRRNSAGSQKSFFCTELVAAAYQEIGVLERPPRGRAASNYIPRDFADKSEFLCLTSRHAFGVQQTPKAPSTAAQ